MKIKIYNNNKLNFKDIIVYKTAFNLDHVQSCIQYIFTNHIFTPFIHMYGNYMIYSAIHWYQMKLYQHNQLIDFLYFSKLEFTKQS